MGSFPETYNDRKRTDETNANKFYKCMRSDVFEKSTKFHTDNVFAWSHCRAFFRAFSVNSPRWRIRGKRLRSDHVTQNALAWGLKGRPFDSAPGKYFLARIFFPLLDIFFWNHPYPPPPRPRSKVKWSSLSKWRFTTQFWLVVTGEKFFWLVVTREKFASTNQTHYPDLGTDTWTVGDFCPCF